MVWSALSVFLVFLSASAWAGGEKTWDFPQSLYRTIGDVEVSDLTADLGTTDNPFPVFVTAFSGESAEAGRTVFEKHQIVEAGSPGHLCLQKQVAEIRASLPRLVPLMRSLDLRSVEVTTYLGRSDVGDREFQWSPGAQSIYSSVWLNQYQDRPVAVVNDENYGRRLQVRVLVSSVDPSDRTRYQKRLQWERNRMKGWEGESVAVDVPELEVFGCNVARIDAVVEKVKSIAEKRVLAGNNPRVERHLNAFEAWHGSQKSRMPASVR